MFVVGTKAFHPSHSVLSRYFIEKLVQQADFSEIISNRHRTVNGIVLIDEIVHLCDMTLKRSKSISRLRSAITEAQHRSVKSGLHNDFILSKYCGDIIDYFDQIQLNSLTENNLGQVSEISARSQVHAIRLHGEYPLLLGKELQTIDFQTDKIARTCSLIDSLIDCIVPFWISIGYSAPSIFEVGKNLARKPREVLVPRLLHIFNGEPRKYHFLFCRNIDTDTSDPLILFWELKNISYTETTSGLPQKEDPTKIRAYAVEATAVDPNTFLRKMYDDTLKQYVVQRNRKSLHIFNDYFEHIYWKEPKRTKFFSSNFGLDPLNVERRRNTLHETIIQLSDTYDFDINIADDLPYLQPVADASYFYHLALGSKSIENSISLLWTSLESLVPYRTKGSDIENIQQFAAKLLSIGSIGRRLLSFLWRFQNTARLNHELSKHVNGNWHNNSNIADALRECIPWLLTQPSAKDDPFSALNAASPLLAKEYKYFNETWGRESFEILLRIAQNSHESIRFQLDRIYLFRNRITHSALMINDYSNLWHHLEWYVGKLLSYCFILNIAYQKGVEADADPFDNEIIFSQFEGEVDRLLNLLNRYKKEPIAENTEVMLELLSPIWLFF